MKIKLYFLFIVLLLVGSNVNAQVELPSLIGDNMVLQRESEVNIWGKAKPNANISLKCGWDGKKYNSKSNAKGEWSIEVQTPVAGGPYEIEISDGKPILIKNIMIGEVWICAGQSNMEMPIKGFKNQPVLESQDAVLNSIGKKNIRMFTLKIKASEKLEDDCTGQWNTQTAEGVLNASAVGYFFADRITQALDVPVGIIITAWGGSSILAWMPEASILNSISKDRMDTIYNNRPAVKNTPAHLYNAMINPLTKYKAKGFLWYQGEENLSLPNEYHLLQAELVKTWRREWNDDQDKMPFYFAQIAPYSYGTGNSHKIDRPLFVESQLKSLEVVPNSKMATTTDLGSEMCIHPAKKKEVGDRLALLALSEIYNMKSIEAEFPKIESIQYVEEKVIIKFKSNLGISTINGTIGDPIMGFEIAGPDKKFYSAQAYTEYSGDRALILTCPQVSDPIAVRYAFRNYIDASLVNSLGVAAPSFRTDDWNDVY